MHKMKKQNQRKQAINSTFIFYFLWLLVLKQRILFITELSVSLKIPCSN